MSHRGASETPYEIAPVEPQVRQGPLGGETDCALDRSARIAGKSPSMTLP
jgi:hypothetical protein